MKQFVFLILSTSLVAACSHHTVSETTPAASPEAMVVEQSFWTELVEKRGPSNARCENLVERVAQNCYISNNDRKRLIEHGAICKQINSKGSTLEAVVLKEAGKMVVVKTRDQGARFDMHEGRPSCPTTKYDIGPEIADIKAIGGRVFVNGKNGSIFMMRSEGSQRGTNQEIFYEIKKSNGGSYSGVASIKGNVGGTEISFLDRNGQPMQIVDGQAMIGVDELDRLFEKGRMSRIRFDYFSTQRSLFRDE